MKEGLRKAKGIALSGILLALTIITLYACSVLPVSKISLYALSSFFISIVIVNLGVKWGWLFYIASSLLSFIIVPNKLSLLPYIVFFGIYGIVKFYIEKIRNIVVEYFLKYVFLNIALTAGVLTIRELIFGKFDAKLPLGALILAAQVIFVVYDYVYTQVIIFYNSRVKKSIP